jgi:hypothetical protein
MHLRFNFLLLNQTLNTIKWINIVVKLKVDQLFNKISLWIIVLKIKNAFNYKTFIDIIINLTLQTNYLQAYTSRCCYSQSCLEFWSTESSVVAVVVEHTGVVPRDKCD